MTEIKDPLGSTLRIFLSVDIVGSTAFKQSQARIKKQASTQDGDDPKPEEPWFSPIVDFYREIERLLAREWHSCVEAVESAHRWPCGEAPELWKSAGDELIYTKILTDHRQALCCIHAWMSAIKQYRKRLRDAFPHLDVKSAAWIAGFPVQNTEVIFRSKVLNNDPLVSDDDLLYVNLKLLHDYYSSKNPNGLTRDFIGPAIDTGFRLAALATPRKLILSVDLVYLLVGTNRPVGFKYRKLAFHYDGRVPLKGVIGGAPYPVFWTDMMPDDPLEASEDGLRGAKPRSTEAIKEFCENFLTEYSAHICVPYIVGNPDSFFSSVPPHHAERLEKLREYLKNQGHNRRIEGSTPIRDPGGENISAAKKKSFVSTLLPEVSGEESLRRSGEKRSGRPGKNQYTRK